MASVIFADCARCCQISSDIHCVLLEFSLQYTLRIAVTII